MTASGPIARATGTPAPWKPWYWPIRSAGASPVGGREAEAQLPGTGGVPHLGDDEEHGAEHEDRDGGTGAQRGERGHREDRAGGAHDGARAPDRAGGRAEVGDRPGGADLEEGHGQGVEDEERRDRPAGCRRPLRDPQRQGQAQDRRPQQHQRVEEREDHVGAVAQHGRDGGAPDGGRGHRGGRGARSRPSSRAQSRKPAASRAGTAR